MEWNGKSLKELRLNLGWGPSELARRLSCTVDRVQKWEAEKSSIDGEVKEQLEILKSFVESRRHRLEAEPKADKIMRERGLDQIHQLEIDES